MRAIVLVAVVGACGFHTNGGGGGGGGMIDAPPDQPGTEGPTCFGSGDWMVCFRSTPTCAITLPLTLDTGNFAGCNIKTFGNNQPTACIIAAAAIDVPAAGTIVTGPNPLVLVATDTISIEGVLDVSSRSNNTPRKGPGANSSFCTTFGGTPQTHGGYGGGGAGASFLAQGAGGGYGDNNSSQTGGGSPSSTVATPNALRGGCQGQKGGDGNAGGNGGPGGNGGGAIYLVAGGTIRLTATAIIDASGAGGVGGGVQSGGGGGGSGGMIVLWASAISANAGAIVVANGASASSGGSNGGNSGTTAADPDPTMPTAQQSMTSGMGASGGDGAAGTFGPDPGSNGASNKGGGGGGAAFGYIRANMSVGSAIASPSVDVVP